MPPPPLTLRTPLADLPGLNPNRLRALERLELRTVDDLLAHYPKRYEDRREFAHFPTVAQETPVCVCGVIVSVSAKRFRALRIFEATIQEPQGHALSSRLTLRWFNTFYVQKMLAAGQRIVVFGRPKAKGTGIVLDHPEFEVIEEEGDEEQLIHLRRITPVYPGTEGLSQRVLRGLIFRTAASIDLAGLDSCLPPGLDPLDRATALRGIHFPEDDAQKEAARRHLAMSEFFNLQMILGARRAKAGAEPGASHCGPGELLARFHRSLPFPLTGAQRRAIGEIRADLAAPRPMNRLLQGDVGAGKTLVALSAMLLAVEAGYQASLMAPTQVLAEQHYLVFSNWLAPLGLRVALRTGARKVGEDEGTLGLPGTGEPDIVIGTHALLYGTNATPRLGLAVIDEQHKFGVLQRARLTAAGGPAPDVLVMTATPIPRTLATTVYGDLDVSTLDEAPANRGKVITGIRPVGKLEEAAAFIRDHLAAGRQAYLVYPLIEESDKLTAKAAATRFDFWRERLGPHRCGLLHGKLGAEEKERTMRAFRAGEIQALVTTTVIEVGIDVKNANIMLIENADRFGLAQLHQLRGRIGRGAHTSYCVLMVDDLKNPEAAEKLRVLEKSSDGFAIAEADLLLRGAGDILGTAQSGLPPLKIGDLVGDAAWMQLARAAAKAIFADDPGLRRPANRRYRALLAAPAKLLPHPLG